jgi:hypothetical protein
MNIFFTFSFCALHIHYNPQYSIIMVDYIALAYGGTEVGGSLQLLRK